MLSMGQHGEDFPSPSALTPDVRSWLGDTWYWCGLSPDPWGLIHPHKKCHHGANLLGGLLGATGGNWE